MPIDGDQISESGGESFKTSGWKPAEPIAEVTDLVFKDSLLYCGFCFGGVSNSSSVTQLRIRQSQSLLRIPQEVPLAEIPEKCLQSAGNLWVELTPEFQAGLYKLKAKIAKIIGCSNTFFDLVFQTMFVYETGAEVARHKDAKMAPKQFGTLFIQPPSTHTGGEMKVYRNLGADEEEVMYLKFGANSGDSACKWQFGFISDEAEYEIAPILTGSRLILMFAAVWSSDQCLRFHGPDKIDQIATQLEMQRANGDFLVAFLRDTYENLEGIGEQALTHADRSLLRLLEAANKRMDKPFKVVLVSMALIMDIKGRVFDYKPEQWYTAGKIEQQWFDLEGNPWPYKSKANLEVMKNVLNPERKSLKQLWGSYVEKQLKEVPTKEYDVLPTYRVTYRRTLVVLWYSDLTIEHIAELEGWDVTFKTLIDKSPDSAALVSFLQLYKKENGANHELEDEIIRLIFNYIAKKNLLDALPSYIGTFMSKNAFNPIILTFNEEIWKTSWAIFLYIFNGVNLFYFDSIYLKTMLDLAQEELAPKDRRYKVLLEVIKNDIHLHHHECYLRLALVLADKILMTTLCEALIEKGLLGRYLEKILTPEFAPLKEKFWTILYSMLEQRIDILKDAVAKGSKPFDNNFPDLEVIFPKESNESSWLLKSENYSHTLMFDNSEEAKLVMEQLKVYKNVFYIQFAKSYDKENEYHLYLVKTSRFWRYQEENVVNKKELRALEKLKDDVDQEPPMKMTKKK